MGAVPRSRALVAYAALSAVDTLLARKTTVQIRLRRWQESASQPSA